MKRNVIGPLLVGVITLGMLTIASAQGNANNAAEIETVNLTDISAQSVTEDGEEIQYIDTEKLGIFGADVYSLDEIAVPATNSIEGDAVSDENEEDDDDDVSEYSNFAIANVTNYVNVRSESNTDSEIVGKIYNGAVAQILATVGEGDDEWFQIISGNVEGYIKAEYFISGDDAAAVMDNYVTRYAEVKADRLNVRQEPTTESSRIGYVDCGERLKLVENQGDWLEVEYTNGKNGYVAAQYVTVVEEFVYAKTIAEEQAEIAAAQALEERTTVSETAVVENVTITVTPPSTDYTTNDELRNSIVQYAMQFLGNKYILGGNSLVTGTDCSGFTMLIYKEFGYSISRTPEGQLAGAGRLVSYAEAKPGDIICYGSSGKCTHVAMYIGNGQIIHAANSRKGVVIYNADYDTILGVKSLVD